MAAASDLPSDRSQPDDLVAVGRVLATHGVRGDLKISADAGGESALGGVKVLWLQTRTGAAAKFEILASRLHSGNFLVSLRDLDSPEAAAVWRGATVCIPRTMFPPAGPDELYWIDLIGCEVESAGHGSLGRVAGVDDHGGGPFLRVRSVSSEVSEGLVSISAARDTSEPELSRMNASDTKPVSIRPAREKSRPPEPERLIPFVPTYILDVDLPGRKIVVDWHPDWD